MATTAGQIKNLFAVWAPGGVRLNQLERTIAEKIAEVLSPGGKGFKNGSITGSAPA